MQNIDDSFLLRNLQDKKKSEENEYKSQNEEKIIKPKAVRYDKKPNTKILK